MKIKKIYNKSWRNSVITLFIIFILISTAITTISNASISKVNNISTMSFLGDDWEAQDSGTTEKLSGVSFVDEDIGTTVGDTAVIIHTDDGGENWDFQTNMNGKES